LMFQADNSDAELKQLYDNYKLLLADSLTGFTTYEVPHITKLLKAYNMNEMQLLH